MIGSFLTFAQMDGVRDLLGQPPRTGGAFDSTDTILILGFIFLLALALFSWAYFIRKRPDDRVGGRVLTRTPTSKSRKRLGGSDPSHGGGQEHGQRRKVRRRRRRSEEHLRRNPTLEETGGLPPPRPDDQEDPPASGATPSPNARV